MLLSFCSVSVSCFFVGVVSPGLERTAWMLGPFWTYSSSAFRHLFVVFRGFSLANPGRIVLFGSLFCLTNPFFPVVQS